MLKTVIVTALVLCVASNVEARQYRRAGHYEKYSEKYSQKSISLGFCAPTGDPMRPCAYQPDFLSGIRSIKVRMHRERHSAIQRVPEGREMASVVSHPAGCPSRSFCGCGAAVRVFGSPVRSLWLAANWFRFPRTSPAPGMVAVRRHHVFVLEAEIGNGLWRVYDANSGKGLTRIHARGLAGYSIVNPHG